MFSEKTRPINAAAVAHRGRDFGTDRHTARVISIMARIHKPHCEGNEDDGGEEAEMPSAKISFYLRVFSQSVRCIAQLAVKIASNRENDLKVEWTPLAISRKAELGGPFGSFASDPACFLHLPASA